MDGESEWYMGTYIYTAREYVCVRVCVEVCCNVCAASRVISTPGSGKILTHPNKCRRSRQDYLRE